MKKLLLVILLISLFVNCKKEKTKVKPIGLITDNGMIVSARKEASEIGVQILKKGGNAFDAMIATDLALAVAYPFAGNIGGGGFMVYRTSNGKTGALDYREKAPLLASRDMYLDDERNVIEGKSTTGALAVGVPGTIAGLFEVHKKFGSLPFKDLIQPAIDLAKKGVVVTQKQEKRLEKYNHFFEDVNNKKVLLSGDFNENDTIKYIHLAKTLERIRDNGKDEFYKGETGQKLVNHLQENGGIITLEDLEKYEAKWRNPIEFDYKDLRIISMTLPSSGGICLAQILKSIEPYNLKEFEHNSTKYIQLITEAERRAYADRSHFLGDIDFVNVPIDSLTDSNYINHRMSDFSFEKATKSADVSHGKISGYESNETTHYSIIDSFGNAVSVTTTLNGAYGSKVFIEELGFFLNNEMDDFSIKPGTPNMFGLIGAEANAIAPEKRMLSSMTPTIVEQNGKLKMVVGSPGGSTIITSVLQNILNVTEFDMGMQESVSEARFHHQWLPDNIKMEPNAFDLKTKQQLKNLGYEIDESTSVVIGKVDAILVLENGQLEGGADPRGDDTAIGF
ncbi:gamma-glutamyltransferase [Urechidicola croceus]|uniref:Glutathione hydrolase proenzyme n=1 Tax=Urechidicola croceus TaxID=1850246 RepID=A0A1D8P658_9FLAO|nr:gamma-glutamyltransferase [Urechidicola croceus]AOW20063.1 gamma-glutamyltransferase [Urechidicola croceus]